MDYGILGSILGSPYFGKLPYRSLANYEFCGARLLIEPWYRVPQISLQMIMVVI